jgi:GGDEF domain-containing protein
MLDLEPAAIANLPGGPEDLEVLRERLGDRTRTLLRACDTLARTRYRRPFGRGPQEEFLVVLPDTRLGQAQLCAERLTRSVRARMGGRDEPVRLAAGISEYRAGDTIADVLRRAEQALHAAQQEVPGTVLGGEPGSQPPRPPGRPKLRVVQ